MDWFRRRAAQWRPDAILVCVFGQVIDAPIIRLPPYGIYNFHPSDLAHHHGAGLAPYDDLVARGVETTVWAAHQVSEEIDTGPIVGQSPPINVRDAAGDLPEEAMVVYNKLIDPLGYMVYFLVDVLAQGFLRGESQPLERLDFQRRFPEAVKSRIMEPIASQDVLAPLADPDPAMFDLG